jgi:hypothetical protein
VRRPGRGQRADGDRGALTLSYIIVMPAFLAGLMLLVQGSLWFLAREAALAAARQGADAARVLNAPPGAGRSAALAFARQAGAGYLTHPRAFTGGSTATTVSITVSGKVPSLIFGLPISVSQTASAPVEQFTTP